MVKTLLKKGKDLTLKTLLEVRDMWHKAFPEDPLFDPKKKKLYHNNLFFLVKDSDNTVEQISW